MTETDRYKILLREPPLAEGLGPPPFIVGRQIAFRVYGKPITQGSMRFVGRDKKSGRGIIVPDTKKGTLTNWRGIVAQVAGETALRARWELLDGPVAISVWFYRLAPKSPKWKADGLPATKPDLDKQLRAIGDALQGTLYREDSRIVEAHAFKRFGSPGVYVRVCELIELANPKR